MPFINRISTGLPANCYEQEELRKAAAFIFSERDDLRLLTRIFENSGVKKRYLAMPLGFYTERPSFERRNSAFVKVALEIGTSAVQGLRIDHSQIDSFFFVTTTGLMTPSLDALICTRLGFPETIARTPIFGVGCAGGVVGIQRAANSSNAVLLSVELCSLTLPSGNFDRVDVVGASLFADGAAAAQISTSATPGSLEIVKTCSYTIPESEWLMGWKFTSDGPRLVLSKELPEFIRKNFPIALGKFLKRCNIDVEEIDEIALHPGGPKVLDSILSTGAIQENRIASSVEVLSEFGNMSSATILFILKRIMEKGGPGRKILAASVGPGFSFDFALLQS